jgi:fucose permease
MKRSIKVDIKYLSRKFILSMLLGLLSTILLVKGSINDGQFGIVIMATVVCYIVGRTVDKKYGDGKITYPEIKDRLISLFSREFVISIIAVIGVSYLCFIKIINNDLWFQIVTVIGGTYNIFNALEKTDK